MARVRELELGAACAEAAEAYRRQLAEARGELEREYNERAARLRARAAEAEVRKRGAVRHSQCLRRRVYCCSRRHQ